MATGKKSFVLYCDQIETFEELSDVEAGLLIKHIFRYVNDQNPDTDNQLVKLAFVPIKQSLKRDLVKFESICQRNSKNGSLGGRPKNRKEPKEPTGFSGNPNKPKKADSDSDSDSDSENDIYINTLGSADEQYFITVVPQTAGSTKYRINGVSGLTEFVMCSQGRLPLYNLDLARRFMRNNDGNQFNDYKHVYNTWNQFTKNQ